MIPYRSMEVLFYTAKQFIMKKYFFVLLLILTSCNIQEGDKPESRLNISDHPQTMATLYNYFSAEYRALAYQAFNMAEGRIDQLRSERPADTTMAIVVDIDETLLDNSPHQALMIVNDSNYPYMWNEWCELANAGTVPGALEFLQYADQHGFQIYYISNRKNKYVREGTIKNLSEKGFPQLQDNRILLRLERSDDNPHPSDKQKRRDIIAANGHEIVLLIGDNLGDFYSDEHDGELRKAQVESFKSEFGKKFIVLPNAIYGNWPSSIGISDAASMDSLLHVMAGAFED